MYFIEKFCIQGVLYGSVGFGCGLIGQGIANLIMTAKRYSFYLHDFSLILFHCCSWMNVRCDVMNVSLSLFSYTKCILEF
jgi:hypothetical protein